MKMAVCRGGEGTGRRRCRRRQWHLAGWHGSGRLTNLPILSSLLTEASDPLQKEDGRAGGREERSNANISDNDDATRR